MIAITERTTYEDLREAAREQSRSLSRYAAVIEIVTYGCGQPRQTVMVSTTPIKSFSRGGQFVGVVSQFRNGLPWGVARPLSAPLPASIKSDELPF